MNRNEFFLVFLVLGLILAGCSYDEEPLPVDEQTPALKAGKKHAVPFKSTFSCGGEEITPEEPDGLFHQTVFGSGNATHMGKTELLIADEVIDMTDLANCTAQANVVLIAANGDELWFNYESEFDLTTAFEEPFMVYVRDAMGMIYGGTGKFENATGNIVYEGDWNVATGVGLCTFTGEIQY